MNYEQKYNEALERAEAYRKHLLEIEDNNGAIGELEHIFPELAESEDEKIRKSICIYLDWLDGRNKDYQPKGEYSIRDMIAWLEKQKPIDEDLLVFNRLISLGYPCDTNGNIPSYEEVFNDCKNALVYYVQQKIQTLCAKKRIDPEGVVTQSLLKDTFIQAYKEGIEATIELLSSQTSKQII